MFCCLVCSAFHPVKCSSEYYINTQHKVNDSIVVYSLSSDELFVSVALLIYCLHIELEEILCGQRKNLFVIFDIHNRNHFMFGTMPLIFDSLFRGYAGLKIATIQV